MRGGPPAPLRRRLRQPPGHVPLAGQLLAGTDVRVCTVIGFPLGANTTAIKAAETAEALAAGGAEFDMVIDVGALKDGRDAHVLADIEAVVAAAGGRIVKVIIDTFFLTDPEKVMAVRLACQAGASFVKASSGIRSWTAARALIDAGAQRLGTSAGVQILAEYAASSAGA